MRTFLTILFFWVFSANATNYYLANGGSDALNGLSAATAWQHISKINSFSFSAGDSIFLNRGDSWNEQLKLSSSGTQGNEIYFGAYGTGVNPVLTGLTSLSLTDSSNYYYGAATGSVANQNTVVVNGVIRAKGRYPNTGTISIYGWLSTTSVKLSGTPPNYVGSELVVKTNNWVYDVTKVIGQSVDTLTVFPATTYNANTAPFFLQNRLDYLDLNYEWCIDSLSKKLYVYSNSGTPDVKYSTIDTLVNLNKQRFITFSNLEFQGANNVGLYVDSNNISANNCVFRWITGFNPALTNGASGAAIRAINAKKLSISNDSILNCYNDAIYLYSGDSAYISDNYIYNIGTVPGMGCNGNGSYSAILSGSSYSTIQYNKIINTGYNSLTHWGTHQNIYRNYIDTFCLVKQDGGGIYCQSSVLTGTYIRSNFVLHGIGQTDPSLAASIYLDNSSSYATIDSNTIYDGTMVENGGNFFNFYDNLILSRFSNALYAVPAGISNSNFKRNIYYSQTLPVVYFGAINNAGQSGNTSDSNYIIYTGQTNQLISTHIGNPFPYYSLSGWKTSGYGMDLHSNGATVSDTSTPSLLINPTKNDSTITLPAREVDVKGNVYLKGTKITLSPFRSILLFPTPDTPLTRVGFLFE